MLQSFSWPHLIGMWWARKAAYWFQEQHRSTGNFFSHGVVTDNQHLHKLAAHCHYSVYCNRILVIIKMQKWDLHHNKKLEVYHQVMLLSQLESGTIKVWKHAQRAFFCNFHNYTLLFMDKYKAKYIICYKAQQIIKPWVQDFSTYWSSLQAV